MHRHAASIASLVRADEQTEGWSPIGNKGFRVQVSAGDLVTPLVGNIERGGVARIRNCSVTSHDRGRDARGDAISSLYPI